MNPFLTRAGRWVLISGVIHLFVGILMSDGVVLLLGQIHIVLLTVAFFLTAPAALALDRRLVELSVDPGEIPRSGTGHVVGDEVQAHVDVDNRASIALHNFDAEPFGAEWLEIGEEPETMTVAAGGAVRETFSVKGTRCGRWVLHGFDVSISDPMGLIETRDYLPCIHAFEFYPRAGRLKDRLPLRLRGPYARESGGRHLVQRLGSGTDLRELRDYQPGDSLRDIAWKATARTRTLISREYEREVTQNVYVVLDVSSSMRGGQWPGQKLEYAVHVAVDLIDEVMASRDRVGLVTFDEKLYGHIPANRSVQHYQRLLHHLVGLNAMVDPELTELDESDVERLAADYLLVQERLDFRKGASDDSTSGVNTRLLDRWLSGVLPRNRELYDTPVLRDGVVSPKTTQLREFLRLRGIDVPYRVEARLGMKERGLIDSLEHVLQLANDVHRIVVLTDLCGIMNVDLLMRGLRHVRGEGHEIEFLVPFTPSFYEEETANPKYDLLRELFTSAEAEERSRIAGRLATLGVPVHFLRPESAGEASALLAS